MNFHLFRGRYSRSISPSKNDPVFSNPSTPKKICVFVEVLCVNSAADVDWLVDKFDLDLSLEARLGGHSQPRILVLQAPNGWFIMDTPIKMDDN